MNLNIFQRKWKGGIDAKGMNELKKQMISGEFCDPTHNDTAKIYTCKMGAPEGQMIRFAGDAGFYSDDIVVYFNNHDDGRKTSLASTDKRCAMALVTKATWNVAKKYDFTYGKNLDELLPECNDVNTTCKKEGSTPAPCTSIPPSTLSSTTTPTTPTTTTTTTTTPSTTATPSTSTSTNTGNTTTKGPNSANQSAERTKTWDNFRNGFLAGFATLLILMFFAALIYCLFCRSHKKKNRKSNYSNGVSYKVEDQRQSTPVSNAGSAEPLPKKTPLALPNNNNNQGINNIGFKRETLERVDSPA
ncbi:Hypothetical predicted protein [Paramuricea clavata]|uniref:Uncharacterized protein n=1 Tax=Paramuricea clavata TaxID=317549 RepID=A0A7D9DZR8_PARCT|nr:Hypothetical predicted protein [Paramuricea clavata]